MSLLNTLYNHLAEHGDIPFVEFMHRALYTPGEGYYSCGLPKLGPKGDFITAPELTPLFGMTLANQCQQVMSHLQNPCILEYGAGSGALAVDMLKQLEHLQCLPEAYYIMEVSASLKHRQHEHILQHIPHLAEQVVWLDRWPETPFNGVILANEVLDAMPVHRFLATEDGLLESMIGLDEQGQLKETFKPCQNERLIQHVNHLNLGTYPYLSEANLFIDDWILNNYHILNQGMVLLIDYGFPRHEYYHPDRHQGTLMCHYQHQAHTNPLAHPGEEDITAHVDFTHVAEAAQNAGFHVAGYTNQASFLLANGLLSLIHSNDVSMDQIKTNQAVKQLIQPSEMGELFKVIALTKDLEMDIQGFLLHDKRVSL